MLRGRIAWAHTLTFSASLSAPHELFHLQPVFLRDGHAAGSSLATPHSIFAAWVPQQLLVAGFGPEIASPLPVFHALLAEA